jgi:hypothetical protein
MALGRWQAAIQDGEGNVQGLASIEVRREVPGAPLASLFADRDGLTPLGNPFTGDADGYAAFHAAGGAYRVTASKGPFSRTWRYVGVGLNSEQDGGLSGPGATVVAGQLAVFADNTGAQAIGAVGAGDAAALVRIQDILDGSALPDAGDTQRGVLETATDAEIRASSGNKSLTAQDLQTAAAGVALADAATVAVNWDAGIFFTLTAAGNCTIGNPSNGKPGQFRTIHMRGNDGTDRTVIFGNQFLGELPTIADMDSAKHYLLTIACLASNHFIVSAKVADT